MPCLWGDNETLNEGICSDVNMFTCQISSARASTAFVTSEFFHPCNAAQFLAESEITIFSILEDFTGHIRQLSMLTNTSDIDSRNPSSDGQLDAEFRRACATGWTIVRT